MVRSAPEMRTHFAAAALALALFASASPAAAQEAAWWTQRITFGVGPAFVENLWSKGRKMRAESIVEGRRIVTFVDEKRYVIIDDLGKNGISIARSDHSIGQDAKRKRPFGNEIDDIVKIGGEKVGEEVRAGQDVEHYRVTRGDGDRDEVWVTKDESRLPVESVYRERQTGAMNRRVYLRWVESGLPDDFFTPPRDVKLESLTYEEYAARSKQGGVGPAPPFYSDLLHGTRD
jgi:hypothetical protein